MNGSLSTTSLTQEQTFGKLSARNVLARSVIGWILTGFAALAFFVAGTMMLAGAPMMRAIFDAHLIPIWFMYFVGVIELAGAVLLLTGLRRAGAGLLSIIMVGAVFDYVSLGQIVAAAIPLMFAMIVTMGVALRALPSSSRGKKMSAVAPFKRLSFEVPNEAPNQTKRVAA